MGAFGVGTHVVQSHVFLGSPGLALEEDGFFVATSWTRMFFGSGKCWIVYHVRYNTGQFAKNSDIRKGNLEFETYSTSCIIRLT